MANERFEIEARGFQHERLVIERFQSEIVLSYGIEKPNTCSVSAIWFITLTLLDFLYIINDQGDFTRPTKRQLQNQH